MRIEIDLRSIGLCVLICWVLIFTFADRKPPTDPPPAVAYEEIIEGVVVRLIPGPDDVTTVVFDDGREYSLALGPHEVYLDEWNQFRLSDGFFVEEIYLGEGTVQELARDY